MTQKTAFSPEEWTLLRIVPSLVSGGVSAADPGGLIGAFKEATAGMRARYESLHQSNIELMKSLFEACLSGCHRPPLDVVVRDFAE